MFGKVLVLVFLASQAYVNAVSFDVINNSGNQRVFISVLGSSRVPGFILEPKAQRSLTFNEPWSGRIWGRIDCYSDSECARAGPVPASLFEMTIGKGNSYYDLSLVDGFNIKLSVTPVGGKPDGTPYRCRPAVCNVDILQICPDELKLRNSTGQVVSCQAACNVFKTDLYCCRGAHDRPETCRSKDWPVDYAGFFKKQCPDAYSYAYDDQRSTFTCDSGHYVVTFL